MKSSRSLVCTCIAALLQGCMTPGPATAQKVPASLAVPATQKLSLEARASGVQIYDCKPKQDDPTSFEWALRAPEAELFDASGRKIGKHYAGPTWEANDGSKVVGEIKARADAPDADAIPWLLLTAKSTSGSGVLASTLSIQRVQTAGGKAPASGCGRAQAQQEVRVPYTAMYYFFVDNYPTKT